MCEVRVRRDPRKRCVWGRMLPWGETETDHGMNDGVRTQHTVCWRATWAGLRRASQAFMDTINSVNSPSEPRLSHLWNGHKSIHLGGLLWGLLAIRMTTRGSQWALLLGCGQSQMRSDEGVGVTGTFCLPGSASRRLVLREDGEVEAATPASDGNCCPRVMEMRPGAYSTPMLCPALRPPSSRQMNRWPYFVTSSSAHQRRYICPLPPPFSGASGKRKRYDQK